VRKALLVVLLVLTVCTAHAEIPVADLLAFAQRISNWAEHNLNWEKYLNEFGLEPNTPAAYNFMNAHWTTNWIFNRGLQGGLDEVAGLRLDLDRLMLYVNQVCDLNLNTWREIFVDLKKVEEKYPELADNTPIRSNALYANPDIMEIVEKSIYIRNERIKRINLISQLVGDISKIEKSIAVQVGGFEKKIDSFSKASLKANAGETSKLEYSHACIRLQTMRARLFGITLMRTLNEFKLRSLVEDEELEVAKLKMEAKEMANYELIKGGK